MVKINNSLSCLYSSIISNNSLQRKQLMSEIVSGRKSSVSVVNSLIGSKLRSDVKIRMTGLNQINHGFHFINSTSAILTSIKNQLEELQNQMVSLRGANQITLQSAQIMYTEAMQRIVQTLKNSEFNGKSLFDGSFADGSKAHASHCLPEDAAPLCVKYGSSPEEEIKVPIARLLPGDGRRNDPSVMDSFMPLLSVTENTRTALDNLDRVENVPEEGHQGLWQDAQRRLIAAGLPEGVSAEQDTVREGALKHFDMYIDRAIQLAGEQGINQNSATSAKLVTKTAGKLLIFCNSHQDLVKQTANRMINTINAAIPNAVGANENQAFVNQVIANIPHDPHDTNSIQTTLQTLAVDIVQKRHTVEPPLNRFQQKLTGTARTLRRLVERMQKIPFSTTLYTGSFLNEHGIENSGKIISEAISKIDIVMAGLEMKKRDLEQVKTQSQTIIIESSTAADNYLNTDYEKIVINLLQLARQEKMTSLAFGLSEEVLNIILGQLEQAAMG